ncbi:glucarate transporter [Vibrio panuliri]|uniref:Glucarate transporter n=3 Tax=Vibrio panuliri TaxID=1381081 RepID=A0A1Q9HE42_9VIBR|nr:MFS transporter [Vibrio panuliri]OLQ87920.1 glucarate transporter [Vibrio panuliri]OLQ95282.1 glucarate transporter [Vibrio panuliri]
MSNTAIMNNQKTTKKRFFIVLLLFISVVINYLDRANLSIAAPEMTKALGLTTQELGWIFSSWGWAYAAMQVPCGALVDKFKPKYLLAIFLGAWSIATLLLGFASTFFVILALRFIVGMLEAPSYPINNRVVTAWIPENERASSIAVYTSGQFIGLALLTPVLAWIMTHWGWQSVFFVTGGVGIVWAVVWYIAYDDPKDFKGISQSELELIQKNGAETDLGDVQQKEQGDFFKDLLFVLTRKKILGICLGQFALGNATIFFLTWFPTYLVEYHGMSFVKAGFMASLPFLCGCLGVLSSGFFSDFLLRKGCSLATSRKVPIISGLLLTSTIIGAEYFQHPAAVTIFMSIAFFATGLASITWSLVSSIAPKRLIGLTGGTFNFIGGLAAIITPVVIGYLAGDSGSFMAPLLYISSVSILGAMSYIFLVGKVERVEDYK